VVADRPADCEVHEEALSGLMVALAVKEAYGHLRQLSLVWVATAALQP
jgi:hypothetical protein